MPTGDRAKFATAGVGGLLVLILAVLLGWRLFAGNDARDNFLNAQETLAPVIQRMSSVESLEGVAKVGELGDVQEQMGQAVTEAAGYDGEFAVAAERALKAQVAFLEGVAQLAGVNSEELAAWGPARDALDEATQEIRSATKSLSRVDDGATREMPDAVAAFGDLEGMMTSEVSVQVGTEVAEFTSSLAQAKTTADVRETADQATALRPASQAALDSEAALGKAKLKNLDAVLGSMQALSVLDAENLKEWPALRGELQTSLGRLTSGDDQDVVAHLDGLVKSGAAKVARWRADNKAAIDAKAADTAEMNQYKSQMDKWLGNYAGLRTSLGDAVDELAVSKMSSDDGWTAFSNGEWRRTEVADHMDDLSVPGGVLDAHRELVSVVRESATVVGYGTQAFGDASYCADVCDYKESPNWEKFRSGSARIAKAFERSQTRWSSAVTSTQRQITSRKIPQMPEI